MKVQQSIEAKLKNELKPDYLDVINESHSHNVPANSETHFKVVAVSDVFLGENAVKRHRRIYNVLADELNQGVHALSLHLYTPEEWQTADVPGSPACLGGGRK